MLLRDSAGLIEKSRQLARKQTQSLLSLVGSGIQMANAFLDVAANTKDPTLKARCISKAEKSHQTLIKLVQCEFSRNTDQVLGILIT